VKLVYNDYDKMASALRLVEVSKSKLIGAFM